MSAETYKQQPTSSFLNSANQDLASADHQSHSLAVGPETLIQHQKILYQGICNLCYFQTHLTQQCPFAMVFYHATSMAFLDSILKNGLYPSHGRHGKALYVSDDPEMCINYVRSKGKKFDDPILIKLKCMLDGEITHLNFHSTFNVDLTDTKKGTGTAIKCLYFTTKDGKKLYEYALIKPECFLISWRPIHAKKFKKGSSEIPKVSIEGRKSHKISKNRIPKEDMMEKILQIMKENKFSFDKFQIFSEEKSKEKQEPLVLEDQKVKDDQLLNHEEKKCLERQPYPQLTFQEREINRDNAFIKQAKNRVLQVIQIEKIVSNKQIPQNVSRVDIFEEKISKKEAKAMKKQEKQQKYKEIEESTQEMREQYENIKEEPTEIKEKSDGLAQLELQEPVIIEYSEDFVEELSKLRQSIQEFMYQS